MKIDWNLNSVEYKWIEYYTNSWEFSRIIQFIQLSWCLYSVFSFLVKNEKKVWFGLSREIFS
jgi:hypothetical protein